MNNSEPQAPYLVLARRTRPQSFQNLVGQEIVSSALETMLQSGRIPHAFLFTGTRGTGKTSSARILAKSLCCIKGPTSHPCQECVHCVQITACAHEDILEIDGASNNGVDNVRELRESARFYPSSARYKIFIIDEVHMLSLSAFNALLKTLEEPPPQVIFILATTELHKVPNTVRSRCMLFPFRKIDHEKIVQHLCHILKNEGFVWEDDALVVVAREARGSMRDALSLLEQIISLCPDKIIKTEIAHKALGALGEDLAQKLFCAIAINDCGEALQILKNADQTSFDLSILLENTAQFCRNALLIKQIQNESQALKLTQMLKSEYLWLSEQSAKLSISALSELFRTLQISSREVSQISASLAWAEVTILDCLSRSQWLSAPELMQILKGGEVSLSVSQQVRTPVVQQAPQLPIQSKNTVASPPENLLQKSPVTQPGKTINSSDRIDMGGFARLISIMEKKSPPLASKLKHALLDDFNSIKIVFADVPQNRVLTHFSENDAQIFIQTLDECGFGNATLSGLQLPNQSSIKRPISKPDSPAVPAASASVAGQNRTQPNTSFLQENREDPFGAPAQPEKKNLNSLAAFEKSEKQKAFEDRANALRMRPAFQKLAELASHLVIEPLEGGQ